MKLPRRNFLHLAAVLPRFRQSLAAHRAAGDQAAAHDVAAVGIDHRQVVSGRKPDDQIAVHEHLRARDRDQAPRKRMQRRRARSRRRRAYRSGAARPRATAPPSRPLFPRVSIASVDDARALALARPRDRSRIAAV